MDVAFEVRDGLEGTAPFRGLQPALISRELSWLDFNRRVLEEAFDDRNPELERARFLAIAAANLDEFYTTRIAWLKRSADRTPSSYASDALRVAEQLDIVRRDASAQRVE